MALRSLFVFLAIILMASCTQLGPKSVPRDRFNYNTAIANSWKEQTLLNIVKIRYADMPLFVEVASVVSGYTLESTVSLGGLVSSRNTPQGDILNFGAAGKFTDRPTITYAPITGSKFNESFMTPITPKAILFLMQSGWQAEMIFPITVDAVNGRRSLLAAGDQSRAGDLEYYRVIELLQEIQRSGMSNMRVIKGDDKKETTVIFFSRDVMPPQIRGALVELNSLLQLDPSTNEFNVVYGLIPKSNREIALQTRSMLQIMITLATLIDVPEAHVQEGSTVPTVFTPDQSEHQISKIISIHSSPDKPEKPFVSVQYRDHWFWIDENDFISKRTFTFLMILFSLTESGGEKELPLVTIPAG